MSTRASQRISVYSGAGAAGYGTSPQGPSGPRGSQDGLFAPSAEVRPSQLASGPAGEGDEESGSETWADEIDEGEEAGRGDEEDPEDDEAVYLTDAHRDWEQIYLIRLAMKIHRMVTAQLSSSEEALFMIFTGYDTNLDGKVKGREARKLLAVIKEFAPDSIAESSPLRKDGVISFVSLLEWYSGRNGTEHKETSVGFSATALLTGLLGSGMVQCDARIQALDWISLRRNVLGYRRLYHQVRELQEERMIAKMQELESQNGLLDTLPLHYGHLAKEFEGDMEHLFELFAEVDESNNLMLESSEVEALLRLLDTSATDEDVRRYLSEINLADGPLSFSSFVDWWDQARNVSNSLIAEKGATLVASIKGKAYSNKMVGLIYETAVQKRWSHANKTGTLEVLRDAYCRALKEVREYKAERDLRKAEQDSAAM